MASRRYTYARTIEGPEGAETFSAVEFDSFDEAISAVERGISDRRLQIKSPALGIGKKDEAPEEETPVEETPVVETLETPAPPSLPPVPQGQGPRQP